MKHKIVPLISAGIMSYFGIKKLIASEVSVTEFTKFGAKIGVDPYAFMYFTGAVEMISVLLILGSILKTSKKELLGLGGHGMLMGTMIGAISTEFFIRDEVKYPLVGLALILIGVSAYYAFKHLTRIKSKHL